MVTIYEKPTAAVLVGALTTALLAAGCATVPTEGPIRNSSQDAPAAGSGGIGVEAQPPRPNADPLPLVNGFVEAMSDSRAFDIAREYMTPEAAAPWKPESKTLVYDQTSSSGVSVGADKKVRLSAPLIGTIDARGSWTPAVPGEQVNWVFELTEVSKQRRVANEPPGVFLGSNQLQSRLAPHALYFFNPSKDLLVPDPVFLPIRPPGQAATQLIQELLKGPTSRLGNGVVSAAPPGTTVNVSVPVESGVATVALSDTAASLTDRSTGSGWPRRSSGRCGRSPTGSGSRSTAPRCCPTSPTTRSRSPPTSASTTRPCRAAG